MRSHHWQVDVKRVAAFVGLDTHYWTLGLQFGVIHDPDDDRQDVGGRLDLGPFCFGLVFDYRSHHGMDDEF